MKKCPICGRYMSFRIGGRFGNWIGIWSCVCGYSSDKAITWCSDRTTVLSEMRARKGE